MKIIKEEVALAVHYAQENANESLTQIAENFAIDRHTLTKYLNTDFNTLIFDEQKRCYIELESHEKAAVDEFKKGVLTSAFQVKKKYGIHNDKFRLICKYCEVEVGHSNYKHHLNRNAFASIETEEDAYTLGFITADGYLSESRNSLFIGLHARDVDILRKIGQYLEYDGEIKYDVNKQTKNPRCSILFCSASLINNLKQYGLRRKKSLHETFYNNLPNHLIRHYIRGLIDGDGFIAQIGKNIGLCGSKDIVTNVAHHLINTLNLDLDAERKVRQEGDSDLYRLAFYGENAVKVMKYLYEDSRIYLDRKYELAKRYF